MIYQLHTRSDRKYRGQYPRRINSWSYSRSVSQQIVARHLGILTPVHIELNDGTRFIAELKRTHPQMRIGMEFALAAPDPVIDLSIDRYNAMLAEIEESRK